MVLSEYFALFGVHRWPAQSENVFVFSMKLRRVGWSGMSSVKKREFSVYRRKITYLIHGCLGEPIRKCEYGGCCLRCLRYTHIFLLASKQKEIPHFAPNRGNTTPPTCSHFGPRALSTRFPCRFPLLSSW